MIINWACLILGIVRNEYYIVISNHKIRIKLKQIPDYIYYRKNEKLYKINKHVMERVSRTLNRHWLYVEKIIE